MKAKEVREKDGDALSKQMTEVEEQMFRIRFQMRMGQTEGLKKYRVLRKDRARILTISRERELAGK